MKLSALWIVALLLVAATAATAAPGQQWILPIARLDGGGWTTIAGAGYGGSDAYYAYGMDGVRRVYWYLDAADIPTETVLYSIEVFIPTQAGGNCDWQPVESQIRGVDGEQYPVDSQIPWVGAWGTNHQYVGSDWGTPGTWKEAGPGPHAPESADFNAGANGKYMWLHKGSWLYAKWDFPWNIGRTWSALRITQVPEPSSFVALLAGLPALVLWRRKR